MNKDNATPTERLVLADIPSDKLDSLIEEQVATEKQALRDLNAAADYAKALRREKQARSADRYKAALASIECPECGNDDIESMFYLRGQYYITSEVLEVTDTKVILTEVAYGEEGPTEWDEPPSQAQCRQCQAVWPWNPDIKIEIESKFVPVEWDVETS